MDTPYDTVRLEAVASTQDVAADEYATRGTVLVVADRQLGGRGRTGRDWWEAPRALYSSLAFAPPWPIERWSSLTLVAGVAVCDALADGFGIDVGLKWPNDVMSNDGKLGGILAEASAPIVVMGCGVNLWWPDAPHGAAAAATEDPGTDAGLVLAQAWASNFLSRIGGGPNGWGIDEYRKVSTTLGSDVTWTDAHGSVWSGRATDITPTGALVVEGEGGRSELHAGEVREVRSATLPPQQ